MTFLIVLQGVQTSLVKISNLRELRILKKIRHIEVDNCTAYQTLTSFFFYPKLVGTRGRLFVLKLTHLASS